MKEHNKNTWHGNFFDEKKKSNLYGFIQPVSGAFVSLILSAFAIPFDTYKADIFFASGVYICRHKTHYIFERRRKCPSN